MSSGIVWMNRATWDSLKEQAGIGSAPNSPILSFCGARIIFDEELANGVIKGLSARIIEYLESLMKYKPVTPLAVTAKIVEAETVESEEGLKVREIREWQIESVSLVSRPLPPGIL